MSTNDSITTEAKDDESGSIADAAEKLATTFVGIGRLWAAHGLSVGRSALQASAETLRATAAVLGEVSSRLDPEDRAEPDAR